MTDVQIEINEWHFRDGTFKSYGANYYVLPEWANTIKFEKIKEIARDILHNVAHYHIEDPEYKITLWEGSSPLEKYKEGNLYFIEYTQKPEDNVEKELTDLLHNKKLISEAEKKVRKFEKKHPDIIHYHN